MCGAATATAKLIEMQVRAELIQSYVRVNQNRIEAALAILDGSSTMHDYQAPKDRFTLQQSIDDRIRFSLIRSLMAIKAIQDSANLSETRDEYASHVATELAKIGALL